MDNFTIIFIVVAAAGIFLFWTLAKYFYKALKKNFKPQTSDDFVNRSGDKKLGGEFDQIVRNLEFEREKYYKKTKGLFKRAFFRTWFILASIAITLSLVLSEGNNGDDIARIIGPLIMTAFLSLIGAGIYTLVKKGTNKYKFSRVFKRELVSKIVTYVNPELTFYDEGIKPEDFNEADLFRGGRQAVVVSEDKIEGIIEGKKVIISECEKRGRSTSRIESTNIKINGKVVARGNVSTHQNSDDIVTYFKGLFIQIELEGVNTTTPLKFIPKTKIKKEVVTGIDFQGYDDKLIRINKEDKIELANIDENSRFEVYGENSEEAERIVTPNLLKVVDYIFNKYDKEGEKVFENMAVIKNIPILKDSKYSKGVFLSIVENKLYLAIEWPEDMFEPDTFLKQNLVESGISQKIYEDVLFIDQLIKEVNLMNKVAV